MEDNVQKAIFSLLEKYAKAYQNKDLDGILKLFEDRADLVVIGTGYDEWIKGYENLQYGFERDFKQADNINVKFRNVTISSTDNVAWISAHMNVDARADGQDIYLPGRLSAVILKINEKWLFTQLHYSLPASEQEEGKAWPDI
ncbi:nuclear transport factor 2 family protein [Methanobacterium sp.]|uniref:nuclear transport factor 2 family protein n=1 Tax=Methanobacterium sp. TaxID=2164 RepID=UPI002AB93226|nr:nuclear transport factor 2 family protein [Methanobacterium sp.]MDY9924007.1 nuclear transport factor 2 family protein [Methanobacterium sp.]